MSENSNREVPMKNLLKRAMDSQAVPAGLESRIRETIRTGHAPAKEKPGSPWTWMAPGLAAATLAAAALVFISVRNGGTPNDTADSYIASVTSRVSSLMRVGLGDHIHCAVFRKYPKTPPPEAAMREELGPEYAGMLDAVAKQTPPGFEVQLAHKCRFQGRQLVHLVLKNEEQLLSVVAAAKKDGESFPASDLVPEMRHSGIPFYQESVDTFQIAAFENPSHLVYVISNLPGESNMRLMLAMAEGLNEVLPKS